MNRIRQGARRHVRVIAAIAPPWLCATGAWACALFAFAAQRQIVVYSDLSAHLRWLTGIPTIAAIVLAILYFVSLPTHKTHLQWAILAVPITQLVLANIVWELDRYVEITLDEARAEGTLFDLRERYRRYDSYFEARARFACGAAKCSTGWNRIRRDEALLGNRVVVRYAQHDPRINSIVTWESGAAR
jgi:hypothetical protein